MQTIEYLDLVDKEIKNYFLDKSHDEVDLEIIQVWYCKTIQNHKGLFIVRNKDTNIISVFNRLIDVDLFRAFNNSAFAAR